MAKQSERTFKMKESYIKLHDEGLSVGEIAERFGLTPRVVYLALKDIAAKAGVTRESLLERPHKPHSNPIRVAQDQSGISLADHETYVEETLNGFNKVLENIDHYISIQEQIAKEEDK